MPNYEPKTKKVATIKFKKIFQPLLTHQTTRTHFSLDPNSLLSTIFRIPALFPTAIQPDMNITFGDEVTIGPPLTDVSKKAHIQEGKLSTLSERN